MNYGWRGHANFGQAPPVYRPNLNYFRTPNPKPVKPPIERFLIVSQAIWCDAGQHAFSSKDPERKRFTEDTDVKDDYGSVVRVNTEEFHICGPCRKKGRFPGQAPNPPEALTAPCGPGPDAPLQGKVTG